MKKLLIVSSVCFTFLLFACKREITPSIQKTFMQTITSDLKTDSTTVTLSSAIKLAQKFLQSKNHTTIISIKSAETIIKNGKPYIHIINTNNNAGFAMLAADSIYEPILAYDSIGNFDKTNLNPGLVLWFNKQGHELEYIRDNKNKKNDSIAAANKLLWKAYGNNSGIIKSNSFSKQNIQQKDLKKTVFQLAPLEPVVTENGADVLYNSVGPLCLTNWNQDAPYNQFCPSGNYSNGHMPAGCVPVAMAQVMRFWNFPTTYNFNIMPKSLWLDPYTMNITGYAEAARLISDIGSHDITKWTQTTSQFVTYSDNGTSTNDYYCPSVFGDFGYTSASRTETVSDQILWGAKNGLAYSGLLSNELSTNLRPCIMGGYAGQNTVGGLVYYPYFDQGHEWVCDGVSQTIIYPWFILTYFDRSGNILRTEKVYDLFYISGAFLHMNWGWGPFALGGANNDGWYNYSINYSSAPNGKDYGYFQTVIYNIHP